MMSTGVTPCSSCIVSLRFFVSKFIPSSSIELEESRPRCDKFFPVNNSKCLRLISGAIKSKQVWPQEDFGVWEDPDEGSDSGSDEEDEEFGASMVDYESDWNEVHGDGEISMKNSLLTTNVEDEPVFKEVEELLSHEEMRILLQNRYPNTSKISSAKWKPIHTLAMSGKMKFMDKLLDIGLNIDELDKDGLTPLHKAILGKKESAISHLLRKGANLEARDQDGAVPLHYAVHVGAIQTVKLLIKHNVRINVADNDGWTPLHVAVQGRNRHIIKLLLINGADKSMKNKDGRTPLDLSLCFGRDFSSYDIAKLLKVLPVEKYALVDS